MNITTVGIDLPQNVLPFKCAAQICSLTHQRRGLELELAEVGSARSQTAGVHFIVGSRNTSVRIFRS
jgi:hypothetical protein